MTHFTRRASASSDFGNLNAPQLKALRAIGSSALINAGAGTGKTHTMTKVYVEALTNYELPDGSPVMPENILAITYTEAAAQELSQRVRAELVKRSQDYKAEHGEIDERYEELIAATNAAWITTINGFCNRIIHTEGLRIAELFNRNPRYEVLDADEAERLRNIAASAACRVLYENRKEGDEEVILRLVNDYGSFVDCVKELTNATAIYGLEPSDIKNCAIFKEDPKLPEIVQYLLGLPARCLETCIFAAEMASQYYKKEKKRLGVIDFGDQISLVRELFEKDELILNKYRERFGLIIIDEFQDTNFVQYRLFNSIADNNLMVVGDKNQSIYSFQGAEAEVFDEAAQGNEYNRAPQKIKLDINYRSHAQILEVINSIFTYEYLFGENYVELRPNPDRVEKHALKGSSRARFAEFSTTYKTPVRETYHEMAEWVASNFVWYKDEEGFAPEDMVVLMRSMTHLNPYIAALTRAGFKVAVAGGTEILLDTWVVEAWTVLHALHNPYDDAKFNAALVSRFGRVPDEDLALLAQYNIAAKTRGEYPSLYELWRQAIEKNELSADAQTCAAWFETGRKMFRAEHISRVLQWVIKASGVADLLASGESPSDEQISYEQSHANLMAFTHCLGAWEREGRSSVAVLQRGDDAFADGEKKRGEDPILKTLLDDAQQTGRVCIMTIHRSKGRQFPVVAVPWVPDTYRTSTSGLVCVAHHEDEEDSIYATYTMKLDDDELKILKAYISPHDYPEDEIILQKSDKRITPGKPFIAGLDKLRDIQELHRIYYVGFTRAQDRLLVPYEYRETNTENRALFGYPYRNAIQAFIERMGNLTAEKQPNPLFTYEQYYLAEYDGGIVLKDESGVKKDLRKTLRDYDVTSDSHSDQAPLSEEDRFTPPVTWNLAVAPQASNAPVSAPRLARVTASGVHTFETCKRQYYLGDLLRVGKVTGGGMTAATTRGTVMHAFLEEVLSTLLTPEARKAARTDAAARSRLLDALRGYEIPRNQQQVFAALYKSSVDDLATVVDAAQRVVQSGLFARLVDAEQVRAEAQFYEPLAGPGSPAVYGFIDAMATWGDSAPALVIDYKSGIGETSGEEYRRQASCYAYALLCAGERAVEVRFVRPQVDDATQPDGFQQFEFSYTASDRENIAAELMQAQSEMAQVEGLSVDEQIAATHSDVCTHCSYRGPLCKGKVPDKS